MSGVEIVGVLLGIFPLLISAAEHYREGLSVVRRAVQRRAFIDQYRAELNQQQALLSLYIKAVIGRTGLSPSKQARLVEHPSGDEWRSPEVVKELKKELGDAYEPFVSLLEKVCATLGRQIRPAKDAKGQRATDGNDIATQLRDLCIDASNQDDPGKRETWQRIKFSWKHPERAAFLSELKEHNISLEKLGVAASGAKPYEHRRKTRDVEKTFELREDSERLYYCLQRACNCQSLKDRNVGLGLAVHHHQHAMSPEMSFRMLLYDEGGDASTLSVKMTRPSSLPAEPSKKKIRFSVVKVQPAASKCSTMKKLGDICTETLLAQKNNARLQITVNEKGEMYASHSDLSQTGAQPTQTDPVISLCDVMTRLKIYDRKRWLHKEKAILAVILSYSLLQLHNSSWLQQRWDSDSIGLLGLSQVGRLSASPDTRYKLRRPYTRAIVADRASESPSSQPSTVRRNAHLHALGIVLLELYLNGSIKDGIDGTGAVDSRSLAQDLLEEHSDDISMTAGYLRAIRFCLSPHPNPYSGSFSFDDRGFREVFYSEVIAMLEDHLSSQFEVSDSIWREDDD